ncbi:MAG: hypothetical protein NXI32_28825, partial [bacterium]|nr:hypothetical protein [bacterium]
LTSDKLGNCRIWQLGQNAGGEKLQNPNFLWQSDSARCFSAIFDAEGECVFTVGQQGRLTKWHVESADSNILLSREQPTEEQVDGKWQQSAYISALFLDEDRELVVVAIDGLYFIDRESGATEFLHHYQDGMRMEFLATPQNDSTAFFVSSSPLLEPSKQATSFASKIQRWDARSRSHQTIFASGPNCSINDLSCSPSGSLLAAVVEDRKTRLKQLLLIQPESGKVIREFPAANGTKPRFTHDGGRLVYGAQRNLYSIDLEGNSDRTNNNAHQNSQVGLAISCDDRWLATCDERVIRIWHLDTLEPHATLLGHQALITSLEFSRDGRTLFSGSIDGTVKAWGVQTGQSLLDLHRGSSPIIRITISQDGNQLAVLEDYATVRVYYVGRD